MIDRILYMYKFRWGNEYKRAMWSIKYETVVCNDQFMPAMIFAKYNDFSEASK